MGSVGYVFERTFESMCFCLHPHTHTHASVRREDLIWGVFARSEHNNNTLVRLRWRVFSSFGWVDGVGWIGWVLALLGIYLPFCLVLSTFLSLHPSLQQTSPLLQNSKPILPSFLPSFLPHKLPHLPTPPLLPTPKKSNNTIQYNTIQ